MTTDEMHDYYAVVKVRGLNPSDAFELMTEMVDNAPTDVTITDVWARGKADTVTIKRVFALAQRSL